MPEIVVIAGGGRRVGKTHLAERLRKILPDAAVVKVGVHHARADKNSLFFEPGVSLRRILAKAGDRRFLVIESGSILDDPELDAALVVFLPAPGGDKPGSETRRAAAHLVRGETPMVDPVALVAERLRVDDDVARAVARAVMEELSPPP